MSIELVQEQILKFIITETPEVLAIKGEWGVGKTYNWNKFIEENKESCKLKSYSYVSLFGANSIGDIKQTTFLNTVDTYKIGEAPNIKGYSRKIADLVKDTKIPYVSKYVGGIGSLINSVSQLAMHKTIICFDDLERHSKGVTIKDFMGLVSYLKEQKKCKIVLLLNEEVGDETFEDYQKYKEKVIDKQINFEPTPEECFDIMVTDNFELCSFARYCSVEIGIKNKRIINKIVKHIKDSLGQISDINLDISIKEKIVRSLVLLSWCYYSKGVRTGGVPDFEYVKSTKYLYTDKEGSWSEETAKEWSQYLNVYGFGIADEIDVLLANGIQQGFFDGEKLAALCSHKQDEIEIQRRSDKLNNAWDVFHGSFERNESEVAKAMEDGLRDVVSVASGLQYGAGLSVLREIGENQKANELIDLFIEERKGAPEIFNLDSFSANPFGVKDDKFADKLKEAYKKLSRESTVEEILELRKKSNSYNQSEVEILNRLSKDEIKDKFLSFRGEDLYNYINVFILLSGSNTELKDKVNIALTEIAAISDLNKSRMGKFQR